MRFNTECENIILEEEGCKGVLLKDGDDLLPVYADEVVIGTGRRGADWLEKLCAEHHIAHKPGTVDIARPFQHPAAGGGAGPSVAGVEPCFGPWPHL